MREHARACGVSPAQGAAQYVLRVQIDHDAAEFPFLQLARILRSRIESGEYPEGRKIPPLLGLQAEFGLSSMTVRRAVGVLVDEGLLLRVPGRGTFVTRG